MARLEGWRGGETAGEGEREIEQTFRRGLEGEGDWRGWDTEKEKLNLGINHAISISLPTFLAAAPDISEIHPVTRQ